MDIYFILRIIIQYNFIYSVTQIVEALDLWHTPNIVYHFAVFHLTLLYLLTVQDAPSSPCIFSVPAPESAISPRSSRAIFYKEIEFISLHKRVRVQTRQVQNKAEWRGWWKLGDRSVGHLLNAASCCPHCTPSLMTSVSQVHASMFILFYHFSD